MAALVAGRAGARVMIADLNGDGIIDLIVSSSRGWTAVRVDGGEAEVIHSVTAEPEQPITASLILRSLLASESLLSISLASCHFRSMLVLAPEQQRCPLAKHAL